MKDNPTFLAILGQAARLQRLAGKKVLLAVSGGADSTAMLQGLAELKTSLALKLEVATIDHGLRRGSAADCEFVRRLCRRLKLRCTVRTVRVAGDGGLEASARLARYRALQDIAAERGCALIATAHTLEDQAETVLLRLARGSGTRGLRGILSRRGPIVRPMLQIERAEVARFLELRGIVPRSDPTNRCQRFMRNRVRATVLPALVEALGPTALRSIARAARAAEDDERYLEAQARQAASDLFARDEGSVQAQIGLVRRLAPALRRRALRRAAAELGVGLALAHVEDIERAMASDRPSRVSLPKGFEAAIAYGRLVLGRSETAEPIRPTCRIDGPGRFESAGLTVEVKIVTGPARAAWGSLRIDPRRVMLPLVLRSRQQGDRFRPRGGHQKKLKAFLIDARIPRMRRDGLPLLCDAAGRVLWVVGVRASDAAQEGERARKAWSIRVTASVGAPHALDTERRVATRPSRGNLRGP